MKKTGVDSWFEWRCAVWGTDSAAEDIELYDEVDGYLIYVFHTAWTHPVGIAQALHSQWPGLEIAFFAKVSDFMPYLL